MDYQAMFGLAGKRAIACGSTQGIGRACAMQFARLGAAVTLIARREDALRQVLTELPAVEGRYHHYVRADFTDPDSVAEAVRRHINDTGPVHILLNNSGGPPQGPIANAAPAAFLKAFRMHLVCNQLLAQAVLPGMKHANYGRIINITSISLKEPIKSLGVSNTTRWAVAAWAKTLAGEVGRFGITVNNILPGYTQTARMDEIIQARAAEAGVTPEAIRESMIAEVPLGRIGSPDETAAAVGFLASPAASYITGINLPVDGGRAHAL